jgi:hypothetical protein
MRRTPLTLYFYSPMTNTSCMVMSALVHLDAVIAIKWGRAYAELVVYYCS